MLFMQIFITIVASAIAKSYVAACHEVSLTRTWSRFVKYSLDENLQKTIQIFGRANMLF